MTKKLTPFEKKVIREFSKIFYIYHNSLDNFDIKIYNLCENFILFILKEQREEIEKENQEVLDKFIEDRSFDLKDQKDEIIDKIKTLITAEINTAHKEGQPTSRLTSLYNKISKLLN